MPVEKAANAMVQDRRNGRRDVRQRRARATVNPTDTTVPSIASQAAARTGALSPGRASPAVPPVRRLLSPTNRPVRRRPAAAPGSSPGPGRRPARAAQLHAQRRRRRHGDGWHAARAGLRPGPGELPGAAAGRRRTGRFVGLRRRRTGGTAGLARPGDNAPVRAAAWLAMLGTVVSVGFTVALARRWRTSRRPFLRSWTIALAAFSTGIGALAYGAAVGFDEPVVRVYYVFGALLAAPWLGLGEVELLGSPRLTRSAGLGLALLLVPAALVVAVQPLRAPVPGGFAVPDGSVLFAPLSRGLVATSNIAGTLAVVGGVVVSGVRARGQGLAARSRFAGACLIGLGVLVAAGAGTAAG